MKSPPGARMDCDMTESPIDLFLRDANATDALGAALAQAYARMAPGRSAVLYLHGELGAGKTTCVRSLLRTLGVDGSIRSPTYTLVEAYELPELTCVHVDLYRLQAVVEVEELGLLDYLQRRALLLVEWPEKGACRLPPADLELTLAYVDDSRSSRLDARTNTGVAWLENLVCDASLIPYVSNLT